MPSALTSPQQMGLAAEYGVLIQKVVPGGAAERAGLHGGNEQAYVGNTRIMLGGDLIVAIDGRRLPIRRTLHRCSTSIRPETQSA